MDISLGKSQIRGVFDGHGGAEVSTFCRDNLYSILQLCVKQLCLERKDFEMANCGDSRAIICSADGKRYK